MSSQDQKQRAKERRKEEEENTRIEPNLHTHTYSLLCGRFNLLPSGGRSTVGDVVQNRFVEKNLQTQTKASTTEYTHPTLHTLPSLVFCVFCFHSCYLDSINTIHFINIKSYAMTASDVIRVTLQEKHIVIFVFFYF